MGRTIIVPKQDFVTQEEVKATVEEITNVCVTLDDGGCVIASWQIGGKTFNETLWDENTTPTYIEIGAWLDTDVDARIKELSKIL